MTTVNTSDTFRNITNTSVGFGGNNDRLTFIGCSSCGVTSTGLNQTVSLVNDSWMVVQSGLQSPLKVVIKGNDSNITINDIFHNINIVLDHQGPYTITNNIAGPISGALINTQHSSIFVMGISSAQLAQHVTAVG
jgi:hypothetical protein